MRLKINLETKKNSILDFNYQYYLASSLYNIIRNVDLDFANKLHEKRTFKFFTFSKLFIKNREILEEGIKILDGKVYLYLSSPLEEFIRKIIYALFESGEIKIKDLSFYVQQISLLESPKIDNEVIFKTLSPICLRTKKEINGVLKDYDLLPSDKEFKEKLIKNLKKKYESFYKTQCKYDIENIKILSWKPKRIKIKNLYFRCSEMIFKIKGDKELLKFGYECGFGEKNSMGFGMVGIGGNINGNQNKAKKDI